jgi:hypothetical protein
VGFLTTRDLFICPDSRYKQFSYFRRNNFLNIAARARGMGRNNLSGHLAFCTDFSYNPSIANELFFESLTALFAARHHQGK